MSQKTISERGEYGEIKAIPPAIKKSYAVLIKKLSRLQPGWENIGRCEFDRKQRGWAVNADLYGYGHDIKNRRLLMVVQIRQYVKATTNGYGNVRKNYYLIGRNENNSVFAHPVSGHAIRAAVRAERDVVRAAQAWMFGVDYAEINKRQGDVALIMVKQPPKGGHLVGDIPVPAGHNLSGDQFVKTAGRYYCLNCSLVHGEHHAIVTHGWSAVIVAKKADAWNFVPPTID